MEMKKECYASVFASFETADERQKWMIEHVINQSVPKGGPVFSFSQTDESVYRDLVVDLLGALQAWKRWKDLGKLSGLTITREQIAEYERLKDEYPILFYAAISKAETVSA